MKYSVMITDQFSGKIDLAEKYLGVGIGAGTYTWWKLFGLMLCILSVLWLLNMLPGRSNINQLTEPTTVLLFIFTA